MKKINCEVVMKDLGGKEIRLPISSQEPETLTLGKAVAFLLQNKGQAKLFGNNHLKIFETAKRFYTEKEVELDKGDLNEILKLIKESNVYNSIILGQLQEVFEDIEKVSE